MRHVYADIVVSNPLTVSNNMSSRGRQLVLVGLAWFIRPGQFDISEGFGDVELSDLDTAVVKQAIDPSARLRTVGNVTGSYKIVKPVGSEHLHWSALDLADYPPPVMTTPWQPHNAVTTGVFPRMIVLGCQKCGTASLFVYLSALNNFIPPINKELHAFRGEVTRKTVNGGSTQRLKRIAMRTVRWYSHKWAASNLSMTCNPIDGRCNGTALPTQAPFEITPRYLSDMRVPYNMHTLLPNVNSLKMVVILRNPIARVWSAYHQSTASQYHTNRVFAELMVNETQLLYTCYNSSLGYMTFGINQTTNIGMDSLHVCRDPWYMYRKMGLCVRDNTPNPDKPWFVKYTQAYDLTPTNFRLQDQTPFEGIVARGLYVDQLLNYLCAGFQPESLLVISQGELARDPLAVAQRVADHVGVEQATAQDWPFSHDVQRQSRVQGRPMPHVIAKMLEDLYRPHTRLLMRLLRTNRFSVNVSAIEKEFGLF
eukprot:m.144903 g.144903  ORF g.144903 m.144903 type:complete len:481 (+) comp16209_c0_seq11:118-1560(+)